MENVTALRKEFIEQVQLESESLCNSTRISLGNSMIQTLTLVSSRLGYRIKVDPANHPNPSMRWSIWEIYKDTVLVVKIWMVYDVSADHMGFVGFA